MACIKCQVRAQHAGRVRKGQNRPAQGLTGLAHRLPCSHNVLRGRGTATALWDPVPSPMPGVRKGGSLAEVRRCTSPNGISAVLRRRRGPGLWATFASPLRSAPALA